MSKDTLFRKDTTFEKTTSSSGLSSGLGSTGLSSGMGSTGLSSGMGSTGLSSGMGSSTGWSSGMGTTGLASGASSTGLTSGMTSGTMPVVAATTICRTAPVVEHIDRPAVIREKIRREEVEEIQPVIHRERERLEVHQMVQPIYEGVTENVRIQQKQLPAQQLPTRTAAAYVPAATERGSVEFAQEHHLKIDKPAMVEEIENRKIIEEVQPVIYKEVVQPSIIRETQPIYEKIVEPYTVTKEVLPPVYRSSGATGTTSFYETGKFDSYQKTGRSTAGLATGTTGTAASTIEKLGEKLAQKAAVSSKPKEKEVITTTTTTAPESLLDPNHPHCHLAGQGMGTTLHSHTHPEKFEKGSSGGQVYAARKV